MGLFAFDGQFIRIAYGVIRNTQYGIHSMVFFRYYLLNFILSLTFLLAAAQCHTPPTPPLPTTPAGPYLRIALLSPTEGELTTFGRLARNGALLAFDEWNKNGGVLDHHIQWTSYDTQCDFESGQAAAQQAIAEGHTFIIGPLCSEAAVAAAAVAEAEQALLISPTGTHPLVTVNAAGQIRPTVFRTAYTWPYQAQAMALFAADLPATKAAVLSAPRDDYSALLANTFEETFTALGGQIVYQDTVMPGDPALSDKLSAISRAGATVLYLPVETDIVNQVGQALQQLGLARESNPDGITLLGSDRWQPSELDYSVTNGSYFTTHFTVDNPRLQTWAQSYKSTYAIEPEILAALNYDSATLLLNAIRQSQSFEIMAVVQTLEQKTFEGVTGPLNFDQQHNPLKPVPILRIDQEKSAFVGSIIPKKGQFNGQ